MAPGPAPRVAALTCSLPDENGWMSRSLWGTALSRKVLEQCELVLAEVNPRMPNIPSDGEAPPASMYQRWTGSSNPAVLW